MKKLIILLAVTMVVGYAGGLMAQTGNTTPIANTATVTAGNVPASISANAPTSNVHKIAGASYTIIPADAPGTPGSTVDLIFTIQNDGNTNDQFTAAYVTAASNGVGASNWVRTWVGNPTVWLAPGASTSFTLQIAIDGAAANNSYIEYQISVDSANEDDVNCAMDMAYAGDNGTPYCGDYGVANDGSATNADSYLYHGYVRQGAATANTNIRVYVTGPVLGIVKLITAVELNSVASVVVPGATISYQIRVSNTGAGPATSVEIRDDIDVANTTRLGAAVIGGPAGSVDESTVGQILVTNTSLGVYVGAGDTITVDYDVTVN
jgi:uncharacterized repeat protein (TIGR01451 family)